MGNTGDIADIAFDQNTDELFSIVYTSNGGLKLYLIDPATAAMQEIGYIGGDSIAMINTMASPV